MVQTRGLMMQVAPRLNARAVDLVRRAWDSLETRYRKSPSGSHWTDNEADTGPLKDADGLLCIIEPFLLAPESFVEPAIPPEEIWQRCREILEEVQSLAERSPGSGYRGFTAAPYPYTNEIVDYVDAAATYLRLICSTSEIGDVLHAQTPDALIALQQQTAKSAV